MTRTDTGIVLQWKTVTNTDLSAYRLYRSQNSDLTGSADFLLASALEDTFYTDKLSGLESQLYYGVTSVDTAGNESMLSSPVTLYFDDLPPAVPGLSTVMWDPGGLEVTWNPVEDGDLHSYNLLRSGSASLDTGQPNLVADSLTATSYRDTTVQNGNTYYYWMTATDTLGNESALSQPLGKTFINEWQVTYQPGWQLISRPMAAADSSVQALYPGADPTTLYRYEGSYLPDSLVAQKKGYWLRFDEQTSLTLEGEPLDRFTIPLRTGWNLIGTPVDTLFDLAAIEDPDNIIIDGTIQRYEGAYQAVQELHPGRGYFLKASAAGTIRISSAGNVTGKEKSGKSLAQDEVQNSFDRLTFEAEGITQHLFIGGRLSGGWNRENFALPPQPPRPDLDVRLADDYRLSESDSVTVSLEAAEFPVAVTLENAVNNDEYRLTLFREGQKPEILTLQPGTESYINKPVDYLSLMPVGETAGELPETVELKPSYPNPFNPATTIRYAIPEQMQVTLEVYDLLGQKVTRLVDKEHSAGNYQIRFNASDLSSGIYFVQILAGSHQEVQKITLIK